MRSSSSEKINIGQRNIINHSNQFLAQTSFNISEKLNPTGICGTLVPAYLIDKATSTHTFFPGLKKICTTTKANYQDEETFFADFCQEHLFGYNPSRYKKNMTQGDIDKLFDRASIKGKVVTLFRLGLRFDKDTVEEIFHSILRENEMAYIAANKHAIGEFKKYLRHSVYDPNDENGEQAFFYLSHFTKTALKYLFVKKNDEYVDLEIRIYKYYPKKNHVISSSPPYPTKVALANKISKKHDPHYHFSLRATCAVNDVEMAVELLKRGADPFYATEPFSAFYTACILGYTDLVKLLISEKGNALTEENATRALLTTLREGHHDISLLLINHIQSHSPRTLKKIANEAFIAASQGGLIDIVKDIAHMHTLSSEALNTSLLKAVAAGHAKITLFLLARYPDINQTPELLEQAILHGHYNVFKILRQHHQQLSQEILLLAIRLGQTRIVKDLLESTAFITSNHIMFAIMHQQKKVLDLLLSDETQFDQGEKDTLLLLKSALNGNPVSCQRFLELAKSQCNDNDYSTITSDMLLLAISHEDKTLFHTLYQLNVRLPASHVKALSYLVNACDQDNISAVKMLIQAGLDPNVIISEEVSQSFKDLTPSLVAIPYYPDITLFILQNSPPPNADIKNALMRHACRFGHINIIEHLIENGMDCNQPIGKMRPLEIAARYDMPKVIDVLLDHGIDIKNCQHQGRNIIIALCKHGHEDLVKKIMNQHPELREDLKEKVVKDIKTAAKHASVKSLNALFSIHIPEQTHLNDALDIASVHGNVNALNVLLQAGAQFTSDYLTKLYQAYQLTIDPSDQNEDDIKERAFLYGHHAIYHFLLNINKDVANAEEDTYAVTLNPKAKALQFMRTSSTNHLFKPLETAFKNACILGKTDLIKYSLEEKKIDLQQLGFDPLEIAATSGHKEIIAYFLSLLTLDEIKAKLLRAVKDKVFLVAASILETMLPDDLTRDLKHQLIPYRADIHDAYHNLLLYDPLSANTSNTVREDARNRNKYVARDMNALGVLLHTPDKPIKMNLKKS